LTLGSSRVNSDAIDLQEVNSLGGVLSRSSVKTNLLDHVAMKIVEINDMSEGFIEGGTRLLGDHDGMTISTHEALEEIEAGEATNRDGADHTLVVHRDDLARELRMDARARFAWKLVRLGELTSSASSLAKSSIDISGRDV
jgi:hypothetical protein